jgi:hypothetical protein
LRQASTVSGVDGSLSIAMAFGLDEPVDRGVLLDPSPDGPQSEGNVIHAATLGVQPDGAIRYFHDARSDGTATTGSDVDVRSLDPDQSDRTLTSGYHVLTLHRDADNRTVRVAVDGDVFVETNWSPGQAATETEQTRVWIGALQGNARHLDGTVHEVRIWFATVEQERLDCLAGATATLEGCTPTHETPAVSVGTVLTAGSVAALCKASRLSTNPSCVRSRRQENTRPTSTVFGNVGLGLPEDFEERFWRRHANPKSGWTRVPTGPILVYALYHRNWGLIAATLGWIVLNPLVFSPPETDDAWMTRAVLAERWWVREENQGTVDLSFPNVLNLGGALGFLYAVYGTVRRRPGPATIGAVVSVVLKLWWLKVLVEHYEARAR